MFGCGGDRDRLKRPLMASAVEKFSDFTVVTSDNPRFEKPIDIINQVVLGFSGNYYKVVENRSDAIKYALMHAKSGMWLQF